MSSSDSIFRMPTQTQENFKRFLTFDLNLYENAKFAGKFISRIFTLVLIQISHPKHACARASQKYRIGNKTAFRGAKDV